MKFRIYLTAIGWGIVFLPWVALRILAMIVLAFRNPPAILELYLTAQSSLQKRIAALGEQLNRNK